MWNRLWVAMQWFMVTFVAAACWADGGIRGPYLGQPSPTVSMEGNRSQLVRSSRPPLHRIDR
jgi:hypothetical protein